MVGLAPRQLTEGLCASNWKMELLPELKTKGVDFGRKEGKLQISCFLLMQTKIELGLTLQEVRGTSWSNGLTNEPLSH